MFADRCTNTNTNATTTENALEQALCAIAKRYGAALYPIDPCDITVREWVSWKCRFGCANFAKRFCYPPYVSSPAETRMLLREHRRAYLIHFRGVPEMEGVSSRNVPNEWPVYRARFVIRIHDAVYEFEQCAFYQGFYKALAFAAYPCIYCNECIVLQSSGVVDLSLKRACRHLEEVRPSMEAVGIDVFSTVRKLNLPIDIIPCENNVHGRIMHTHLNSYGLLLID